MAPDVLVSVEAVSKKFCRSLRRSLWYAMGDIASELNPFGRPLMDVALRPDEFWAVRDVSFTLRRGECLGLIGRNGAGKTTLLKMLNGLIKPDAGRIAIRGRVGALIALGAGFNPLLTGRENIYVNGSVLGIPRAEIDRQFDEIVGFAEIGDFIDAPVQNYSSGMQIRLGFSVAVKLIKPDVLILDEVIAVGDEGFRSKCYEAVGEMLGRCAVLFVSHSMPMVYRLSTNVMVLSGGACVFCGDPALGIETYFKSIEAREHVPHKSLGTGDATLHRIALLDEHGASTSESQYGRPYSLSMDLTVSTEFPEYELSVTIMGRTQEIVGQCHSKATGQRCRHDGRRHRLEIAYDAQLLNPGRYWINVVVFDTAGQRHLSWEFACLSFSVVGSFVGTAPIQLLGNWTSSPVVESVHHDADERAAGSQASRPKALS